MFWIAKLLQLNPTNQPTPASAWMNSLATTPMIV
jgi:hypothetical protein